VQIPPASGLLLAGAVLLLGGCGGNFNTIYRHQELSPQPAVIAIDAKQRLLLSNRSTSERGPNHEQIQRFCSEPSPDVLTVVAQALSMGGTF
jgi:hypothetical protein